MTTQGDPPSRQRPPRPAPDPMQSHRLGRLLQSLGWTMLMIGVICLAAERTPPTGTHLGFVAERAALLTLLGVSCTGCGAWTIWWGKRHVTPVLRSIDALTRDEQCVLFLRSFADDAEFARRYGAVTEEEQLACALAGFGRMIALGRPGDRLPPTGAARHYASDGQWQSQVLTAVERANLILLACGRGHSLRWELEQIIARNQPERLILVVCRETAPYESFAVSVGELFPKGLPIYRFRRLPDLPDIAYSRAVVWFDTDWTPHLEYLGDSSNVFMPHNRRVGRVGMAFQVATLRVFERAGRPDWDAVPSTRPWQVTIGITTEVLGWLGLGAWTVIHAKNSLPSLLAAACLATVPTVTAAITLYSAWRRGAPTFLARVPGVGIFVWLLITANAATPAGRVAPVLFLTFMLVGMVLLHFHRAGMWLQVPRRVQRPGTSFNVPMAPPQ